jgi:hypothetical protein
MLRKTPFTAEEDAMVVALVRQLGVEYWPVIAARMRHRTARQCRERWVNYLNPMLSKSPWSGAEDAILRARFVEFGPKWVKLTEFLPTRSANDIKNRRFVLERLDRRRAKEAARLAKEVPKDDDPIGRFFADTKVDIFADGMSHIFLLS